MNETKLKRIINIVQLLEERKALYEELDALTLEVMQTGFTSGTLDGMFLELKDNFAKGNCAFRPAAVRRFEFEIMPIEEKVRKDARKLNKSGGLK